MTTANSISRLKSSSIFNKRMDTNTPLVPPEFKLWRPPSKKVLNIFLKFLPAKPQETSDTWEDPFVPYTMHFMSREFKCLQDLGKPCPLCAYQILLRKHDEKLAYSLSRHKRGICQFFGFTTLSSSTGEVKGTVKAWAMPETIIDKLESAFDSDIDLLSPDSPFLFNLRRDEANSYAGSLIADLPDEAPELIEPIREALKSLDYKPVSRFIGYGYESPEDILRQIEWHMKKHSVDEFTSHDVIAQIKPNASIIPRSKLSTVLGESTAVKH